MYRSKSAILVLALWFCFGSVAIAQRSGSGNTEATQLHVYARYSNNQPVGPQTQVELINGSSVPVSLTFARAEGQAAFSVNASGTYYVRVSGPEIEATVSDAIYIDLHETSAVIFVTVHRKGDSAQTSPAAQANPGTTSANQLKIPSTARKTFDKALDALQCKDFRKAAQFFQKAIDAYPQYDAAYDNLGVAFMQMGQTKEAGAAFRKAVELDDKNADANRNYSRFLINDKQYAQAEQALKRVLMVVPQDPASLALLAIAEFQTKNYDEALQCALKVHQISDEGYASVHYIAGRVYELRQQPQYAIEEYETYLKESPQGPQAEQVRAALARLSANANSPSPSSSE